MRVLKSQDFYNIGLSKTGRQNLNGGVLFRTSGKEKKLDLRTEEYTGKLRGSGEKSTFPILDFSVDT